jgi:hypothetical protein
LEKALDREPTVAKWRRKKSRESSTNTVTFESRGWQNPEHNQNRSSCLHTTRELRNVVTFFNAVAFCLMRGTVPRNALLGNFVVEHT